MVPPDPVDLDPLEVGNVHRGRVGPGGRSRHKGHLVARRSEARKETGNIALGAARELRGEAMDDVEEVHGKDQVGRQGLATEAIRSGWPEYPWA